MIYTTLNQIRNRHPAGRPCESGWKKLLAGLNKTCADDEPISMAFILENNGFDDALWVVDSLNIPEVWRFRAEIAARVLHIFNRKITSDPRPRQSIQAMLDYADGKISKSELDAAMDAAWDAACAALDAAWAARASSRAAASAAAWAARAAARASACSALDASWAAASAEAWAARAAARLEQLKSFKKLFCQEDLT